MEDSLKITNLERKLEAHILEDAKVHTSYDARLEQQMTNVDKLVMSTQGLVDAWTVANGLHKFIKWISGFAIVIAAAIWIAKRLI